MKKLLWIFCFLCGVAYARIDIVQDQLHISRHVVSWIEIKNRNLTRQQEDYSCGSASLSTILTYYYDQNVSEKEILDSVLKKQGITRENILQKYKEANGLSFLDLSEFAGHKGFKALGLALDMEALKKLQVPVILYVKIRDSEHFTVLKGIDETYAYLADPSMGNTKVRLSKFKEMFFQRGDLKYPGKILAILPVGEKIHGDARFMKLPKSSSLIYQSIGMGLIVND